jgi:hypothetical protein
MSTIHNLYYNLPLCRVCHFTLYYFVLKYSLTLLFDLFYNLFQNLAFINLPNFEL